MSFYDALFVVALDTEDELSEVEIDLSNVPVSGRAIKIGEAILSIMRKSTAPEPVVTVTRYSK